MARKQTKRTKPPAKPKQSLPRRPKPSIPPQVVSTVCGLTDPFCEHASGAKYPDDSSIRTLPWSYHTTHTMTSDSSGNVAITFFPNYQYAPFATSVVGPFITNNALAVNTSAIANVNKFRIVSWGAKVRRVSAPLTSSGLVRIRVLGDEDGANLAVINGTSYARSEVYDIALQDCKETNILGVHSSQMPENFYEPGEVSPTSAVTDWSAPGFTPITLMVSGGPASVAVVEVEIIVHYELLFTEASGMTLFATPAPIPNPIITAAAKRVTAAGKHVTEMATSAFLGYMKRRATAALAGLLGGPVASGAMMIADARSVD